MILKSIKQQISSLSLGLNEFVVPNIDRVGDGVLIYPNSFWADNKCWFIGDITDTGNNQLYVIEFDFNRGVINYTLVGIGTVLIDAFDHPAGFLFMYDDYIYCGQTNTHNEPIDIWKSNTQLSTSLGFVKSKVVNGVNAYPQPFLAHDNKYTFCIRTYTGGSNFHLAIQRSDSASPNGNYTHTQITNQTITNYRHYNGHTQHYGTNTKTYLIVNWRNDTGNKYFMHSVLVTSDFATYSNYQGTYSKNVVSTSPITSAELETNFSFNGSSASDTDDFHIMTGIQINDVFYAIAIKSGTTDHYIFKISGTTLTSTLINISNLYHNWFMPFMYYDGTDILMSVCINNAGTYSKKIYRVPLDLSDFTDVAYSYEPTVMHESDKPIMLPQNYNEIVDGNGYPMYVDHYRTTNTMILDLRNTKL